MTHKQATQPDQSTLYTILWPIAVLILALLSIQIGASLAKSLFSQLPPMSVTTLRLVFSACMMAVLFRVWRQKVTAGAWPSIIIYGLSLTGMNLLFYISISRIPIGVAVALEFLGPLCVILFHTRTWLDGLWVTLAVIGLYLLSPLTALSGDIDTLGVVLALIAGIFWATYIIYGKRAGSKQGTNTVAFGSIIAAIAVLPFGIYSSGWGLINPAILPMALLVALFASAIPYTLEMIAMRQMPQRTFGILLSLEPVIAAIIGIILLSEYLSTVQWIALCSISAASIGSTIARVTTKH